MGETGGVDGIVADDDCFDSKGELFFEEQDERKSGTFLYIFL